MHLILLLGAFIVIVVFGLEFVKKFGSIIIFVIIAIFCFQFLAGPQSIGRTIAKVAGYTVRTTAGVVKGFTEGIKEGIEK